MRRLLSFALALAMMSPALASAAQAAIGTWLAPEPGHVVSGPRAEVAVGFNTQSDLLVTALELYVDGKFYARKRLAEPSSRGVCSFWWDISKAAQGSHDLVVKIFAGDQVISRVSGTGVVGGGAGTVLDVSPPTVVFENIKSGDVLKGKAPIKIRAVDDSGRPPMVSLLVNDMLKMLRNTPPYTYDLDTTTYPDGDHQLTTYAYDQSGNRSDPAVVKVVFSNGIKRPIVAAMTITRDPEPASAARNAELPPPTLGNSATTASAGRIPASDTAPAATPPIGKPVAADAHSVKLGPVTTPAAAALPAAASAPENVPARAESGVQMAEVPINGSSALQPRAALPGAVADPLPSVVAMIDASVQPRGSDAASMSPVGFGAQTPSEPDLPRNPVSSALPTVAVSPDAVLASDDSPRVMGFAAQLPETIAPEPQMSPATDLIVAGSDPDIEDIEAACSTAEELAPAVPEPPAEPVQPVRTALVSDIGPHPARAAVHDVPSVKKDAKARIEERAVAKSGKVKARTLFEGMGGVLFWAQATRTVTIYLDDMKIELRIGKKTALVNGTEMKIDMAPYIANGRTIIDAGVYHQACALVQHAKLIRQA